MRIKSPENISSPENSPLEKFVSLGRKLDESYQKFIPFYNKKDYPEWDREMEQDQIREYHSTVNEIERIKKETPLKDTFSVVNEFIKNVKELSALNPQESLMPLLLSNTYDKKDLKDVEFNIRLSTSLDKMKEKLSSIEATFRNTKEMMDDYLVNYEIKKAANTLVQNEQELREIFTSYKDASSDISTMVTLATFLINH